ncbi:hypothetical protein V6N12_061126 [Hibiscus sabdariffa]|uniref:Uncharacterized protein n=1 Tax=Hibiscus sabdariffa TaxID=183260 RepID=A0ABR2DW49_9ROSI
MMSLECLAAGIDKLWNIRPTVAATEVPLVSFGVAYFSVDRVGALTILPIPHVPVSAEGSACCNEPAAACELPICTSEPVHDPFPVGPFMVQPVIALLESSGQQLSEDVLSRNSNQVELGVADNSSSSTPVPLGCESPQVPTGDDVACQQSIVQTNVHPMVTCSKVGTYKPKLYYDATTNDEDVPHNIHEALQPPEWKTTVEVEFHAL